MTALICPVCGAGAVARITQRLEPVGRTADGAGRVTTTYLHLDGTEHRVAGPTIVRRGTPE
jgi:hypothetical protein